MSLYVSKRIKANHFKIQFDHMACDSKGQLISNGNLGFFISYQKDVWRANLHSSVSRLEQSVQCNGKVSETKLILE